MTDPIEPQQLILLGGGGHALVVAEAAIASGWHITGFLDDSPDAAILPGLRRLGSIDDLENYTHAARAIVAIGDVASRRLILNAHGLPWATVIHPTAWVSPSADVGDGVFIGAGVIVQGRSHIGNHAILNTGTIIEHDCEIGTNAHIAPRTALAGGVRVGRDTLVGIGACAIPGVTIGKGCVIGAGSVVVHDVDDGQTVVGIPAKVLAEHE